MSIRSMLRQGASENYSGDSGIDNGNDASAEYREPTEAELKIIQARKERSDKISKRMGEYLLRGWKMLDKMCDTCSNILMQQPASQGEAGALYCIACQELESDVSKDDPALSAAAALSHVRESSSANNGVAASSRLVSVQDVGAATSSQSASGINSRLAAYTQAANGMNSRLAAYTQSATGDWAELQQGMYYAVQNSMRYYTQRLSQSTEPQETEELMQLLQKMMQFAGSVKEFQI